MVYPLTKSVQFGLPRMCELTMPPTAAESAASAGRPDPCCSVRIVPNLLVATMAIEAGRAWRAAVWIHKPDVVGNQARRASLART